MGDPETFERRVADAFSRYADLAPVTVDHAIAEQAIASGRRGSRVRLRVLDRPMVSRRVAVSAALALLLLGAVVATLIVGSALDRTPRLPGRIVPIGPADVAFDAVAAAPLDDGRVLLFGGVAAGAGDAILDPATGVLTPTTTAMIERRAGSTATTLTNGLVLIAGGEHPGANSGNATSTATAELFDPATGRFTRTGSMATSRTRHTATLLSDGRVLVAGGWVARGGSFDKLASAEVFDASTGSWTTVGSMASPRDSFTATRLADGRVLILGGWADGGLGPDATAEVFDPLTGMFAAVNGMSIARGGHTATLLPDGRLLIVGGSPFDTEARPELYDPATGSSSLLPVLTTPRSGHSATLLPDGHVLIAGGTNLFGNPLSTELFDPASATFQVAASAAGAHGAIAVRLADGRVLLADGSPEIFDPRGTTAVQSAPPRRDGVFAPAGPMDVDRYGHLATRLPDGRVMVSGGNATGSGNNVTYATAIEVFDPAAATFSWGGTLPTPNEDVDPSAIEGQAAVAADDRQVLFFGDTHISWDLHVWDAVTGLITDRGPLVSGPTPTRRILPRRLSDGTIVIVGPPVSGLPQDPVTVYRLGWPDLTLRKLGDLPRCGDPQDVVVLPDDRLAVLCGRADAYALVTMFDPRPETGSGPELPLAARTGWIVGLSDGRVLVASGRGATHLEVLDPDTFATTDAGEVTTPEFGTDTRPGTAEITMTRLADGRVLILGGTDASVWDPNTGSAIAIPGPQAARHGHTATLLDDGRVLVAGGTTWPADRNEPIPPGAEIFDPNAIP